MVEGVAMDQNTKDLVRRINENAKPTQEEIDMWERLTDKKN